MVLRDKNFRPYRFKLIKEKLKGILKFINSLLSAWKLSIYTKRFRKPVYDQNINAYKYIRKIRFQK